MYCTLFSVMSEECVTALWTNLMETENRASGDKSGSLLYPHPILAEDKYQLAPVSDIFLKKKYTKKNVTLRGIVKMLMYGTYARAVAASGDPKDIGEVIKREVEKYPYPKKDKFQVSNFKDSFPKLNTSSPLVSLL